MQNDDSKIKLNVELILYNFFILLHCCFCLVHAALLSFASIMCHLFYLNKSNMTRCWLVPFPLIFACSRVAKRYLASIPKVVTECQKFIGKIKPNLFLSQFYLFFSQNKSYFLSVSIAKLFWFVAFLGVVLCWFGLLDLFVYLFFLRGVSPFPFKVLYMKYLSFISSLAITVIPVEPRFFC